MTEEKTRKTYILQKDTPDSKAGTKFINSQNHIPGVYMAEGDYRTHRIYLSETVENNPEWFLIEEEHLKKSNSSSQQKAKS